MRPPPSQLRDHNTLRTLALLRRVRASSLGRRNKKNRGRDVSLLRGFSGVKPTVFEIQTETIGIRKLPERKRMSGLNA